MKITINNAGKRYNFEWILQHINLDFRSPGSYAILGPNGSGKSTLLQLIAGNLLPSSGSIDYRLGEKSIEPENIFRFLTFASPYLELIEEFTAEEIIRFQSRFKPLLPGLAAAEVIKIARLERQAEKQVKNYSSGMKQRLKLTLALTADVPLILLDEPTTNLDEEGFQWYLALITQFLRDRLLILCSNLEREYVFCSEKIEVMQFKGESGPR